MNRSSRVATGLIIRPSRPTQVTDLSCLPMYKVVGVVKKFSWAHNPLSSRERCQGRPLCGAFIGDPKTLFFGSPQVLGYLRLICANWTANKQDLAASTGRIGAGKTLQDRGNFRSAAPEGHRYEALNR